MEIKAIKFKNYTDKDFTWTYDSVPFTFKAGTETYLEDYKARHFAKHLIDRELNEEGVATNRTSRRLELETLCLPKDEEITPVEALQIEEPKKKAKKKVAKTEEFEN